MATLQNSHFQTKHAQIIGGRTNVMVLPTHIRTTRKKSETVSPLKMYILIQVY